MFSSRRTHDLEHLVDTAGHSRERKERSITSPLLSAWPRSPLLAPSTWLQPSYRIAKFALTLPFIILLILWVTYPLSNSRSPGMGDASTTVEVPVYNQTAANLLAELQAAVAEKAAEQAAEQAAREAADQERFITGKSRGGVPPRALADILRQNFSRRILPEYMMASRSMTYVPTRTSNGTQTSYLSVRPMPAASATSDSRCCSA